MERLAAIDQIKNICGKIAVDLMRIHPLVPPLNDAATQDEIYRALYQITKDLEVIKKKVGRLGQQDAQPDL